MAEYNRNEFDRRLYDLLMTMNGTGIKYYCIPWIQLNYGISIPETHRSFEDVHQFHARMLESRPRGRRIAYGDKVRLNLRLP